jgi:hypothetical protein
VTFPKPVQSKNISVSPKVLLEALNSIVNGERGETKNMAESLCLATFAFMSRLFLRNIGVAKWVKIKKRIIKTLIAYVQDCKIIVNMKIIISSSSEHTRSPARMSSLSHPPILC